MDTATGTSMRIPMLTKTNYDTWKLRVQAILTKNRTWAYVNGRKIKPELVENNAAAVEAWIEEDEKARADLYLTIGDAELKQVRHCATSRDVWLKLESIFESRGPARKAALWKKITTLRMEENHDVSEHMNEFFDIINQLSGLDFIIGDEQQAIMLLNSLPDSYDNFRCAIQSRDNLPDPEILKIKILDEVNSRKEKSKEDDPNAMYVHKQKKKFEKYSENKEKFKYKCHKCRKIGHKAVDCPEKKEKASIAEDISFLVTTDTNTALRAESTGKGNTWCLDSGCTSHFCNNENSFSELMKSEHKKLNLASNASTEVKAKGSVRIMTWDGKASRNVNLENALCVPDLRTNLMSVAKITDKDNVVIFKKDLAIIKDKEGEVKVVADRVGDLYYVKNTVEQACNLSTEDMKTNLMTWHYRFGHLNKNDLLEMCRKEMVIGMDVKDNESLLPCSTCSQGKITATPFPKQSERISELLDIIHTDVWGPSRVESRGKARYFATFIDDHSRWCEIYFLKNKSDVFRFFKDFKCTIEKQTGRSIKCIQSDNAKEYCSKEFDEFLKTHGIKRRLTIPHTPQQNGIAERKNRTLVEMARCMIIQSSLPKSFWAEAISTANYVRNRCTTRSLNGKTPFEVFYGKRPVVKHFKIFGEEAYTLDKNPGKGKFDPRGIRCLFVGYDEKSKAYRVWLPNEQKIIVSRDLRFQKNFDFQQKNFSEEKSEITDGKSPRFIDIEPLFEHEVEQNEDILEESADGEENVDNNEENPENGEDYAETTDQDHPIEIHDEPILKRGPGRPSKVSTGQRGRPAKRYNMIEVNNDLTAAMHEQVDDKTVDSEEGQCVVQLAEISWGDALNGTNAKEWKDAIINEMECLIKNDTWSIVDRPKNRNIIGCRIVLRNKYNSDGTIERRKARAVAKGFTQRPGVDYHDTFAPVARLSSVRFLLALSASLKMIVHQLDITTAYLNGIIEEEIYMEKPEMLLESLEEIIKRRGTKDKVGIRATQMITDLRGGNKVCKLNKSLYGLKQAGHQWHKKFDNELRLLNLKPSASDPCVYSMERNGELLLVLIYVDDILVAYRNTSNLNYIRNGLMRKFELKDLGNAKYCLGIEILQTDEYIAISQSGFIRDILLRFGMEKSNAVSTPVDLSQKLKTCTTENKTKRPYQELIGALNYLSVATRPDISFIVSALSQFNTCYGDQHWTAAKRVIRYLKGTINYGIVYMKKSLPIQGFVDADWASCQIDRRSYTGYAFIMNNAAISWESKKQRTVALSSTEAEYMALTEATKESLYLRKFALGLGLQEIDKMSIKIDNQSALMLAKNSVFHARSKHIDIKYHFVREVLKEDYLEIEHVSTDNMAADILTKGLSKPKHYKCMELLGIRSIVRDRAIRGGVLEYESALSTKD